MARRSRRGPRRWTAAGARGPWTVRVVRAALISTPMRAWCRSPRRRGPGPWRTRLWARWSTPRTVAKAWLLELLAAAPLAAAGGVPVEELAAEGPALCEAVARALGDDAELERFSAGGDLFRAAARVGELAGAGDAAAAFGRASRRCGARSGSRRWARCRGRRPSLVADLADRLGAVCAAVDARGARRAGRPSRGSSGSASPTSSPRSGGSTGWPISRARPPRRREVDRRARAADHAPAAGRRAAVRARRRASPTATRGATSSARAEEFVADGRPVRGPAGRDRRHRRAARRGPRRAGQRLARRRRARARGPRAPGRRDPPRVRRPLLADPAGRRARPARAPSRCAPRPRSSAPPTTAAARSPAPWASRSARATAPTPRRSPNAWRTTFWPPRRPGPTERRPPRSEVCARPARFLPTRGARRQVRRR